jgi:hypothetical protein
MGAAAASVSACVRACVCACVRVCAREGAKTSVRPEAVNEHRTPMFSHLGAAAQCH